VPNLEEMSNEITYSVAACQPYAVVRAGIRHAIRLLRAQNCRHLRTRKSVVLRMNADAEPTLHRQARFRSNPVCEIGRQK